MSETNREQFLLRFFAGAAGVAALALIVLALLPRPFAIDHFAILLNPAGLTPDRLASYADYLASNLSVDGVYLLGHIGMWAGYALLIRRRQPGIAAFVLGLGLLSGMLDFLENAVRWSLVQGLLLGAEVSPAWAYVWKIVLELSFVAIFVTVLVVVPFVLNRNWTGKLLAVVSGFGLAGVLTVYTGGYLVSFLWLILWHLTSAIVLWVEAGR